ncbi:MAG: DUF86 domain-containing protein [Methanocorpusculum sp.]|nr:DUF86 domain-containing protein [Methanocorpusculum sp.]
MYLKHMADSLEFIISETAYMTFDEFNNDKKSQFAMVRAFEILGEAVKNISSEYKDKHTDISWKAIAGTRDVLIHRYFSVDVPQVWTMIEKDVPELYAKISALLKSEENL